MSTFKQVTASMDVMIASISLPSVTSEKWTVYTYSAVSTGLGAQCCELGLNYSRN